MKNLFIISTICLVLFSACKKEIQDPEFTVGVSAYSFEFNDTMNTKVFIDGQEYFNEQIIEVGVIPAVKEFKTTLKQGTHKIRMENLNKSSVYEEEFELTNDKMWAAIEFRCKDISAGEKHSYHFWTSKTQITYY